MEYISRKKKAIEMQKDNIYETIRKTEKESQLLWEKPQIGKKGEIPEYNKEIRGKFRFHYWMVGHEYDGGDHAHLFDVFPRNKPYNSFNVFKNPLVDKLRRNINDYKQWGRKICVREITVAELKDSEELKWGLAIYKPDDKVEIWKYRRENVEVKIDDGWEIPPFAVCVDKNHRINFTKKLGQAWAIKDYERKYGAIENERM
jgi:hypothetical protein